MTDKATFTRASATGNLQSLITNYNANLDVLEGALDDSLSLSGKLPNSLTAPLDMNSQRIINLADAQEDSDAITKRQLDAAVLDNISLNNVNSLTFDNTPTDVGGVGRLIWNDTDGTLDLGLKGGNVILQLGQELFTRVLNKTGLDFLESNYSVVRVDGAQGQRVKAVLAQADSVANAEGTLGLITETILNNKEGFVTTTGLVRNINTTGSLQGESWADGDILYLSQTTAGGLTKTKPMSGVICKIGIVEHAHSTQGKIFVHVENFSGLQQDTFTQAGSGAVTRNLQDKVREIVSVKDFGAVGNGTTDDIVAIQAAVDYASSLYGAEVFFPCGNYKITSPILQRSGSNITLRGQGNLQGGTNIIATGAYFIKTADLLYNSINFYHLTFVGLRNGTQSFWDQSAGGSWGFSTMEGCYIVNVPIFDVLTTGAHILNNNFLNEHTLRFRGGDYYIWNNFMGYDDQDTTKGAGDAFVEIYASTGVDFSGNYITSMKTSGAPAVLSVSGSAGIRVISNWIDGGESHGLSVNSGSSNVVATHNRFANIYSSTNIPVLLSNVRTVSIQHNIVQGLLANAPFIQFASLLKRCVVKDNLLNGWDDDSVHDFTGALKISDVKMSGYGLAVKAITTSQDITPPLYGRTLTNNGASGTVFWYVYPSKFFAGDHFNFTRTNTGSRVIIYDSDAAATIYDSNTAGFNKGRVMCYADGSIVVESGA